MVFASFVSFVKRINSVRNSIRSGMKIKHTYHSACLGESFSASWKIRALTVFIVKIVFYEGFDVYFFLPYLQVNVRVFISVTDYLNK